MRYEFFFGLSGTEVMLTLEQYQSPWEVISMGRDNDGFWMLLRAVYN